MVDVRISKLAKILVDYSVAVKKNDQVLISVNPDAWVLGKQVYRLCLKKGAFPYVLYSPNDLDYFFFRHASKSQLTKKPEVTEFIFRWADKFIRLFSDKNNRALANIDPQRLMLRAKTIDPIKKLMLKKAWVLTQFPSESLAQSAAMSLEELEKIYFRACLQDWSQIARRLKKLKKILDHAKQVEIIGKKTHLQLSFTGRLFQAAAGKYNLPDGEIFAAPVDNSASGHIYFDLPSLRSGKLVTGIHLTFEKGKVTKAVADTGNKYLQAALATDAGAKRLGEFALGSNYGIKKPLLNTLFDEKIGGTIHLALGNAYPDKEGGGTNQSAIHWDLIKDMRLKGSKVLVNGRPILQSGRLMV